jgi:ribosomal protein L12E/L44/L45/RPP1/RPP2
MDRSTLIKPKTPNTTQVKTIPEDFFVEEDQLSRGNFLQPCLRSLVRNARDLCMLTTQQQQGQQGQQQQEAGLGEEEEVDDDDDDEEEEEEVGGGEGSQDLGRYVDRFAALMERRFRGLTLGRAAAAAAEAKAAAKGREADDDDDDDDDEEEDGPVVVPWEEVARAMGELRVEGGEGGAGLSTIEEEDPSALSVAAL